MTEWWEELNGSLQVFYAIGSFAGLALLLQLLLLAVGVTGDFDIDADEENTPGFLSIRGITAFFFVFGWVGAIMEQADMPTPLSVGAAVAAGGAIMAVVGLLWRKFSDLEEDGSIDYASSVGAVGTVYLAVSDDRAHPGRVEVMVQGRMREVAAYAEQGAGPAAAGERVEVIATVDPTTVLVRPIAAR